jgi:hypothetical protein
MTFVDGGGVGGGVVDRLRQIGHDVTEVQFGGKAEEARKYANKRAEIWGRMREWLSGGYIEDDERITIDLTSVEYSFTSSDQIQLEKKVDMKKRGLASPDDGDALAITFAQHIPEFTDYGEGLANPRRAKEYDPYA